jgi:hypothetical protein
MYYRAPATGSGLPMPGRAAEDGKSADVNARAVWLAIKVIQRRLNIGLPDAGRIAVDGRFGAQTRDALVDWQDEHGVTADGIFGPESSKRMFSPVLFNVVTAFDQVLWGLVAAESNWDPGAVGYQDQNDLGLCQINGPSAPGLTEAERINPASAFSFAQGKLLYAIEEFDGNASDAVASYNLGVGGASTWIKAGRPDSWTPRGSTTPRHVGGPNCTHLQGGFGDLGYIDRILRGYEYWHQS